MKASLALGDGCVQRNLRGGTLQLVVVQVGIFHHSRTPDVAKAITFVSEKTAASCFTMKEKCIDSDKSFVVNSTSNFKVKGWHASLVNIDDVTLIFIHCRFSAVISALVRLCTSTSYRTNHHHHHLQREKQLCMVVRRLPQTTNYHHRKDSIRALQVPIFHHKAKHSPSSQLLVENNNVTEGRPTTCIYPAIGFLAEEES